MNNKERLELAHWTAEQAKKAGASEAAVWVGSGREIDIECREGRIDKLQESTSNGLSLSVYLNGRYSSNNTNDLRKDTLGRFIEEAVAMTKYLGEDPYRSLPDPKYYEGRQEIDLDLCDKNYDSVSSDQRVKLAREVEDHAMSLSDKIVSCTAYYSDGMYESARVHSNGFEGSARSTIYTTGVDIGVTDDKGTRPRGAEWKSVRHFQNLPAPGTYGDIAVERALACIGQTKMESGSYDIVVENRTRPSLIGALQGPMSGSNLQQKNSCLEGKLGEQVFSELLTVKEDPFIKGALGSGLYDADGFPCRKRTIIEKGVLKEFFIDWYYSRKLGVEPTGGDATNVIFELGERSLDEMIKSLDRGILITGFIGGNSNSTTGDFSFGITGTYVEGGKLIKPINEMNISGNILEFWKQLSEVGNDPYEYSSLMRPSMTFKGASLTGA